MNNIELYQGDCLEIMKDIPNGSVDMILCDLPYGTLKNVVSDGWKNNDINISWDIPLNNNQLFEQYNRILRQNGAILLFSKSPLTEELRTFNHSNIVYHYSYIWKKNNFANPYLAKKVPLSFCENIDVFFKEYSDGTEEYDNYRKQVRQWIGESKKDIIKKCGQSVDHFLRDRTKQFITQIGYQLLIDNYCIDSMPGFLSYEELKQIKSCSQKIFNLPENASYIPDFLEFPKDKANLHPTQKPVVLLEYLIRIYTNENMTVLDNCMGSGSTGIACLNTNRNFIGIELDPTYFDIAVNRIKQANEDGSAIIRSVRYGFGEDDE